MFRPGNNKAQQRPQQHSSYAVTVSVDDNNDVNSTVTALHAPFKKHRNGRGGAEGPNNNNQGHIKHNGSIKPSNPPRPLRRLAIRSAARSVPSLTALTSTRFSSRFTQIPVSIMNSFINDITDIYIIIF